MKLHLVLPVLALCLAACFCTKQDRNNSPSNSQESLNLPCFLVAKTGWQHSGGVWKVRSQTPERVVLEAPGGNTNEIDLSHALQYADPACLQTNQARFEHAETSFDVGFPIEDRS